MFCNVFYTLLYFLQYYSGNHSCQFFSVKTMFFSYSVGHSKVEGPQWPESCHLESWLWKWYSKVKTKVINDFRSNERSESIMTPRFLAFWFSISSKSFISWIDPVSENNIVHCFQARKHIFKQMIDLKKCLPLDCIPVVPPMT